jgi:hypothetical protein
MAENDEDLELEDPEDAPEIEEGAEDETDYKALAIKNAGIAKRNATKLAKLKERIKVDKKVEKIVEAKKDEPDYAKLAYLEAKGIFSDEDIEWVEAQAKDSGKSLRELFANKYFQADLKERKEAAETKEAIPNGSKRSTNSTKDTVEYWIAKGEMPKDNPELARKVVAEKRRQLADNDHFAPNAIV